MKKEPKRRDRGRQSINGISAPLRFETLTLGFCRNLPRLGVEAMSNEHATMRLSAFRHVDTEKLVQILEASCRVRLWTMGLLGHGTRQVPLNDAPHCSEPHPKLSGQLFGAVRPVGGEVPRCSEAMSPSHVGREAAQSWQPRPSDSSGLCWWCGENPFQPTGRFTRQGHTASRRKAPALGLRFPNTL